MTSTISNAALWTTEKLIDELTLCLCSIYSCTVDAGTDEIHIRHKYYDRAEWLIYRINVWKPIPEFVVNISDLTYRLKKELKEISSTATTLNCVMTRTIGRIFESVSFEYCVLNGITGRIRWRLEP